MFTRWASTIGNLLWLRKKGWSTLPDRDVSRLAWEHSNSLTASVLAEYGGGSYLPAGEFWVFLFSDHFRNEIGGEEEKNPKNFSKTQHLLQLQLRKSLHGILQKENPYADIWVQDDEEYTIPFLLKTCKVIARSQCKVYTSYPIHQWRNSFLWHADKRNRLVSYQGVKEFASAWMLMRCLETSFLDTVCSCCYWIPSGTRPRGTVCMLTCEGEENLLQSPEPVELQVHKVTECYQMLYMAQRDFKDGAE